MNELFLLSQRFHAIADPIWIVGLIIALFSTPSVLLGRRGTPLSALSWLFAIFALPIFGAFLWWAIGKKGLRRPKKRRALRAAEYMRLRNQRAPALPDHPLWLVPPKARQSIFSTSDNLVEVYFRGVEAFSAMEKAIVAAKSSIYCVFYIWQDDPVGDRWLDLLAQKAKDGLHVCLLLDSIGSAQIKARKLAALQAAGGHAAFFMGPRFFSLRRPTFNFRNHRKILVVDESLAFTGGMNVGQEYAGDWQDVHLAVSGDAVGPLLDILLDDWYFATRQYVDHKLVPDDTAPLRAHLHEPISSNCTVVASGPDDTQPWMHDAFFRAFTSATQRIWVATPYFIPSESISTALRTAAGRGVDVRILVPQKSDLRLVQLASRAYYEDLLEAGARIYEYEPNMLHAKVAIIDETVCTIGSANVDPRSFRLNFEVGCFFESADLNAKMSEWFESKLEDSREARLRQLLRKPRSQRLLEATAHLLSPML